jgi:hypothetical protein
MGTIVKSPAGFGSPGLRYAVADAVAVPGESFANVTRWLLADSDAGYTNALGSRLYRHPFR